MKKKILIITHNLIAGGSQKKLINLFNEIKKKNSYLFVYKKKEVFLKINKNDPNLLFSRSKKIWLSFFEIKNLVFKKKFNIIYSSGRNLNVVIGTFFYFFKFKGHLIFGEQNTMNEFKNKNIKNFFRLLLMKIAYKKAHSVIANSLDTKKDLIKYKITTQNKIHIISNPIKVSSMKLDNIDIIKKNINKKFVIVACGSLTYQKNFQLLIHAFHLFQKKISNSYLLILGDGPMKNDLNNLIKKYKMENKVKCLGLIKNPYSIFKISNMFVLSSRYEGFGNVIVEAMHSGIQIVCTNCPGGPKEILNNGRYGYLAKNENVKSLYNNMIKSYYNPKKYDVKNIIKKYSAKNISKKYYSLFTKKNIN